LEILLPPVYSDCTPFLKKISEGKPFTSNFSAMTLLTVASTFANLTANSPFWRL